MSASGVVADTHTIIWYLDSPAKLTAVATTALDDAADNATQRIFISAISLIEMRYLTEKNRINAAVLPKVLAEIDAPQPIIEVVPIDRTLADSLALIPRQTVPEMPDRIIAATALLLSLPLVTADTKIRLLTNITTI